jgi:hypothetical protein
MPPLLGPAGGHPTYPTAAALFRVPSIVLDAIVAPFPYKNNPVKLYVLPRIIFVFAVTTPAALCILVVHQPVSTSPLG